MRRISLNDLPLWCPHLAPLLQSSRTSTNRTFKVALGEYDQNYAECLKYYHDSNGLATVEDIKRFQWGFIRSDIRTSTGQSFDLAATKRVSWGEIDYFIDAEKYACSFSLLVEEEREPVADTSQMFSPTLCVSMGDELYEMDLIEANRKYHDLLAEAVCAASGDCKTIVEFGADYGYVLYHLRRHFPEIALVGADASSQALQLAEEVFGNDANITFQKFNFYDSDSYAFIKELDPPVVFLTSHALEQLPSAVVLFETLADYRDKVRAVVHFEPLYRPEDETLLSMLRRCYTETWDYNRDLRQEIQQRSDIKIVYEAVNVIGRNPLNPSTLIRWEYV